MQTFSSVQLISHVQLFVTPWTAACQSPRSSTTSWSLLKFMSVESVILSNRLILCPAVLLLPASRSFPMSWLFMSGGQSIGASFSTSVLPVSIQGWLPLGLTGLIFLLSQESSPALQFKSINSSALSLLYGPVLTSVHDYWENHSFDSLDLCQQSESLLFSTRSRLVIPSKEQVFFHFMAVIIIHGDFGAQENKICHCFHFSPQLFAWSNGTGCHDLSFLNVEF